MNLCSLAYQLLSVASRRYVIITAAGYATLYAPVALAIPTGVTAYVAAFARPIDSYILATGANGVGFYADGAQPFPGFK